MSGMLYEQVPELPEPNMTEQISFIGLGAMGEPMARTLHQQGLLQAVWN